MYQKRFWSEFYQLKIHINYIELYLQKSVNIDRSINIFLALTSSGSIAGWAIWQNYALLWAIIVASSQVATIINKFLPYKTRMKNLSKLLIELESIMLCAEEDWYDISEGLLTKREIHDLQLSIKHKKHEALKIHLANDTLPKKNKLFKKAQISANKYFDNFYPVED